MSAEALRIVLHIAAGLPVGVMWGAYDALQNRWRKAATEAEVERYGDLWHALVWPLRLAALVGLPTLGAWSGSYAAVAAAGLLALAAFDLGHNYVEGQSPWYVGTVARTDRWIRASGLPLWVVFTAKWAVALAVAVWAVAASGPA